MDVNFVSFLSNLTHHPIYIATKTILTSALRELYCFIKTSMNITLEKIRGLVLKIEYISSGGMPLNFRAPENFDYEYKYCIEELNYFGMGDAASIFSGLFQKYKSYVTERSYFDEFNKFYLEWQNAIRSIKDWSYWKVILTFLKSTFLGITQLKWGI